MLEQLVKQGEKIYEQFCQSKKGDKLERMTWIATSLRYIEAYAEESVVNESALELDIFDEPLDKEQVVCILAVLRSDLFIKQLKETTANK